MADLLRMAPSLHRLRIPGQGAHLLNCYLWLGPDGVTLVDTGWPGSAALIEEALAALGRSRADLRRVVLTHFHEDHAGSAAELAAWGPVEVVAGAGDAPFVEGAERGPLPRLTAAERALRPESPEPPQAPPCRVDLRVSDGDVLPFAGGTRVLSVPGHTPGSIALYLPEPDTLLTGDAAAELGGAVILGVFDTDRGEARRSLARLAGTGAQRAGFGHGEAVLTDASARLRAARDPLGE